MSTDSIRERKDALRKQAHANRNAQENKDELSRRIVGAFMSLPEYAEADTVMFYIDVRSEVRTRNDLEQALQSGKTIVVPWCNEAGELELFRLGSMQELELGMYRILEPRTELRGLPEKQVDVQELDLIMVPGVAFDRRGARMGPQNGECLKNLVPVFASNHAKRRPVIPVHEDGTYVVDKNDLPLVAWF